MAAAEADRRRAPLARAIAARLAVAERLRQRVVRAPALEAPQQRGRVRVALRDVQLVAPLEDVAALLARPALPAQRIERDAAVAEHARGNQAPRQETRPCCS